ncbi:pilin [Streptomyces sp. NPDC050315]|uniref:pilin n=1 Tax=Streptomyces sp. NPDC050315 TaxID=3155039 RepID=UPI003440475B
MLAVAVPLLLLAVPASAHAAELAVNDIPTTVKNLRNWLVGILAVLATLFLTIGGLRYLLGGGEPGEVEKAKGALRCAAIGYALALLAPVIVEVLNKVVGA